MQKMTAHSCLCMLSLPVCWRPDQPCHREMGGAQVLYMFHFCLLATSPQCLVTVKVLSPLCPVKVAGGEGNVGELWFGMLLFSRTHPVTFRCVRIEKDRLLSSYELLMCLLGFRYNSPCDQNPRIKIIWS